MTDRFMSAADFRAAMALLHERGISRIAASPRTDCTRSSNAATTSRGAGLAAARPAMSRWP
jgi:hypothetical protein